MEYIAKALAQSMQQNKELFSEVIEKNKALTTQSIGNLIEISSKAIEQSIKIIEHSSQQSKELSQRVYRLTEAVDKLTQVLANVAKPDIDPVKKSNDSIVISNKDKSLAMADLEPKGPKARKSRPFISDVSPYDITITALDLDTGECVVSTFPSERLKGKIIDPIFFLSFENNPYIHAFSKGEVLHAIAKSQLDQDGKVEKLFIVELNNQVKTEETAINSETGSKP